MEPIRETELIAAGPLGEALAEMEAELAEVVELAPDSYARILLARQVKRLRDAITRARLEAPTCDSEEAADIMGVSERQATKLAKAGVVEAEQRVEGGPWTFKVRSCHAYAGRKRNRRKAS